ncbi:MAG TPA: anion permease [Gammaproteobacteria bacterium]|nr:anion permease [Gammaproteobacteria bacterium]
MAGLLITLWYIPVPEGLTLQVWHLFAIFLTTIISIILNVLPMGALAVLALAIAGITETLTIKQCLSAFSSNIVWLILLAFLLARGFIKTGLGARIAYYFVQHMGKSTLGLAYGIISTEFLLAPFTPSNTARGAGIVYPIVRALSEEYESSPQKGTERKIGAYLMKLAYQTNVITSAMFLTASSGNPLIVSLASKFGVEISWTTWALAALVPGVISLALLPWVLRFLYPAEIQQTPKAPQFAKQKLAEMGALTKAEWIMLSTFGLLLTLWAAGPSFGIDPTVSAFVGLAILLSTNVLTWDDILKEQNAWHTFMWLTTLLMMSSYLSEFGMITWFGDHMRGWMSGFHWMTALGLISLIYFYTHYAFASITAHISAMYSAFAVVAIATGAPATIVVLIFAFLSSLCAGITHYGTGTGPVYYGADYIKLKDWWRVGGILSLINLSIWMIAGAAWWKILGLW